VSILFALSGALFLRRSQRAKLLLTAAVISFLVELPLLIAAFVRLVSSSA
jgi:hypothetical protein